MQSGEVADYAETAMDLSCQLRGATVEPELIVARGQVGVRAAVHNGKFKAVCWLRIPLLRPCKCPSEKQSCDEQRAATQCIPAQIIPAKRCLHLHVILVTQLSALL
jgi:hypothetical protein